MFLFFTHVSLLNQDFKHLEIFFSAPTQHALHLEISNLKDLYAHILGVGLSLTTYNHSKLFYNFILTGIP